MVNSSNGYRNGVIAMVIAMWYFGYDIDCYSNGYSIVVIVMVND